ncbi:uncharacterized protein [Littorina saxatilis]|uniref:uncharacterized protein n=1 Tax=Littorina saxatilis TaxID=31220 RepID=UPI0038B499F8
MASYSRSSPRPNEGDRGDAARIAPYLEEEHNDFGEYDAEVRLCSYYGPCHDFTERFVRNSPDLFTRGSYYPSPHVPDDGRESDNWSDENEQDEIWAHHCGTHEPYPQNGEEFRNSTLNPYDFVRGVGSPDELARSRPDSPPHYGCWADLESEEGIREGNSGTSTSITFSKASEYRYGMYESYLSVTDPDTLQNDITDERSASLSEYRCGMYEPYLSSVTDLVTLQSEITEQRSANPPAYADHEPFGYEKGEKPKDEDLQPDLSISGKQRDEKRFQPLPSTSGNAYRNNLLTQGERYGKHSLFGLGILHSPADSIDYEPPFIKQVHEDGCSEDSDDALSVCCETCGHISHCAQKSDNQSLSDSNLSSDFSGHGYEADDSSDEEDCDTIWPFCQNWLSHNRREMDTAHTMDESYSEASYHATLVKEIIDDSSTSPSARVVPVPEPYLNEQGSKQKDETLQPDMIISGKQRIETGFQHLSPAARNVYRNIFLCGEEQNGRNSDTLFEGGHSTRRKDCFEDNPLHIPTELKGDKQESRIDTCRAKAATLRLLLKKCEEETVSVPFREKEEEKEADKVGDGGQETLSYSFQDSRQYTSVCIEDSDDALAACSHHGPCYDIHHSAGTSEYMSMCHVHSTVFSGFLDDEHEGGHWSDEEDNSGVWPFCYTTASQNRREMDTAYTMDESYSEASYHDSWASHNRREMDTALTMNEANSDASYHATLVKEIIDDSSARLSARVVPQPLPNENGVKQTDLQPDPFISGEEIAETAFQHLPTTSGNAYRNNFLFSEEQHGGNSDTLYEGNFSLRSKDFFERNSSYIPTKSHDDTEEPNTGTYQTLDEKDDIPVSDDEEADDFWSPMISDCHQQEAEGNDPKSRETEESTFGNRYQEVLATRPSAVLGNEGVTGHRTIADGRDGHTINEGIIDGSRNKSSNRTFTTAIESETGVDIVSTKDEYHSDASEKLPSRDTVTGDKPASTSSEMISGTFQRIARGLKRDPEHLQPDLSTHTEPGVKTNLHASHTKLNGDRIRHFGIEEQHTRNWDTLCEQGLWHNTNDCFQYRSLDTPTESNGDGAETNIASHQARANAFRRQEKMAQEDTVQMLAEGDEDMSLWSFTNDKESADYERSCLDCDSMPRGEDLNNHRTQSPKKSNRSTTNKEHHFVGAKFDDNHERASKVIIKNSSKCEASNVDIQQRDEVTTLRLSLGNMLIKQKARKRLDLNKLFLCIYGCSIPEDEEKDQHSQSCQSEGEYDSEDEDEYLLLHQKKDKTSAKTNAKTGSQRSTCLHQERDNFVHRQEREETSFASDDLESNYTLPSADQCHRVAEPGIYNQDNKENVGQGQQATHEPADVTENPGNVSVGDFRIGHNGYTGKPKQNAVLLKVPDENHTCTNERNGDESCQDESDTFHSTRLKQAPSDILHHVHQIKNVKELASASRITAGIRGASLVPDQSHDTDRDDRTFSAQQISDDINEAQNGCDQTFLCGDALLEAQPSSLRTNGLLATNATKNQAQWQCFR